MDYVLAAIFGFAGGAVGGLLGVGGGILFVPALVIFLDLSQIHAESTSLLAIVPVALVGAWRQNRYGNVRLRDGIAIGLLSPIGVLIGVLVSNTVSQRALELGFAALLLVVAAQLTRRALVTRAPTHERQ
ncbi:MAG TPA: sulfite exporter TauE/SafE family protein [Acidimicrobiia bacterium]|jgi:hypothetical protein|nr:sulfite exporter TauE/SafE family protein [Acidimicrobiia bacterium]